MSPTSDELPAVPAASHHAIGRRALLGLAILAVMSGGVASLLYGSIEPDTDFGGDPEAAKRRAMLATIATWSRTTDLDAPEVLMRSNAGLHVIDGAVLAGLKVSAAQKLVEDLQAGPAGSRRPIVGAVVVAPRAEQSGLANERKLIDELLARGLDGVFLDCGPAHADIMARGSAGAVQLVEAVADLTDRARLVNPDFLVIIENAAEMTVDPRLHRRIDGVARDDLLFGQQGVGVANNRTDVITALHDLNRVKRSGRPVFVTEHLPVEALTIRTGARQTLSALGFIGRFAPPRSAS